MVMGRDHLDCGSVASPFRETEQMKDGSDAVADWPLLNALLNTASGASWVSIHNGGGVGIGYSQHAGQVTVADGTRRDGAAHRARADERSGDGRGAARGRGLRRGEAICRSKAGVKIPMEVRVGKQDGTSASMAKQRARRRQVRQPAVLLHRISQLVTMSARTGSSRARRGRQMREIGVLIETRRC